MPAKGQLYTISAPSGAGKTSLVKALTEGCDRIKASISHTTRTKREGEIDGINYFFVSSSRFESMLAAGEFLEHAQVFNHSYGTSRGAVESNLCSGCDVILEIDWQGAEQIKQLIPNTLSIFILPPSLSALQERLTGRGQDDQYVIAQRMQAAVNEISHYGASDYLVINDDFQTALADLNYIVASNRLLLSRQQAQNSALLQELLSNS